MSDENPNGPSFNYYFLFIALFTLLLIGIFFYITRHLKFKAAQRHQAGIQALARDIEALSSPRPRHQQQWSYGRSAWRGHEHEPLDDEEVPPPYNPADKGSGVDLRLNRLEGDGQRPPEYNEVHGTRGWHVERPAAVVVMANRQDRDGGADEDVLRSMARPSLAGTGDRWAS